LGLIKVEPFLLAHPKMPKCNCILICTFAPNASPYVINKAQMGGKKYGINFVVATSRATTWATNDYLT